MIIPRHWASARVEGKTPKGNRVVVRRGWSDESLEAARAHATERAEAALRRLIEGDKSVAWRDPADRYGEEGLPICEEIIASHGPDIVTRNTYGAHCLNTPDVLFADIDLTPPATRLGFFAGLAALFGRKKAPKTDEVIETHRKQALAALSGLFANSPDVLLRVYATPAGLRLAAEHALFEPAGDAAKSFFARVDADPNFVRLCALQQCFRARLTAKPWRCGMSGRNRPGSGRWPETDAKRLAVREKWIRTYEEAASRHAACSLLTKLGFGTPNPRASAVLDLHDRLSGATSGKPPA